jgi:hypothetical protein
LVQNNNINKNIKYPGQEQLKQQTKQQHNAWSKTSATKPGQKQTKLLPNQQQIK